MEFLDRWIDEYLELFGKVAHFHLGADEAWSLGSCGRCAQYAKALSLSDLYVNHVNALAEKLAQLGVTPVIWADMVLHHNEALDKLSRDIMLFDWMYDIRYGMGKFWVWGKGWVQDDAIPGDVLDKFGEYLFPEGDEPGKAPEAFYTADFLAAQGLSVVTCPAASSYGDNVFAPRNWYHMANTFDSCHKGLSPSLSGSVLTSWSVHLHPWELQARDDFHPAVRGGASQCLDGAFPGRLYQEPLRGRRPRFLARLRPSLEKVPLYLHRLPRV